MANTAFKTYANEHGGRVLLLLLLFLPAIYEFIHAGFSIFAIICSIPIIGLVIIATFRYKMLIFWALIIINYIVMWHGAPLPRGIPGFIQ